jgi:hypothetical protein
MKTLKIMGVVKAGITISAWPKPTGAERKIITSTEPGSTA